MDAVSFSTEIVEQLLREFSFLLQHSADVNALSQGSQTPLHISATASNSHETAMTLLMESNIDTATLNNSNGTAADSARRTGLTFPVFEMDHSANTVDTGLID